MTHIRPRQGLIGALVIGAMVALMGLVPPALGYIGQAPVQVGVTGPSGVVPCADDVTIIATVVDTRTGAPVTEQVVAWELTEGIAHDDALSHQSSVTDAQGQASVVLSLGDAAGVREVTARVTIVETPIQVRCDTGLPQTTLAPADVDDTALGNLAVVAGPQPPARRLRMARLGISAPIIEGDGVDVPLGSVAHHPGTAWPGEGSNTYLYGHARRGLFRELWRVRTGDLVEVELANGELERYRVAEIRPLVRWDDLSVLQPTDRERLTLQTCLWYGMTSPRLVVIADHVVPPA
jgi:LPXTG-site transpeptidase (sortase) family protein